jgi:hypothetical protein
MFKEDGVIEYVVINGKKVPKIKCETEVVVRNKKTNQEYNSDVEAKADIDDPTTDTTEADVTRSVKIKVAKMPNLGTASTK